MAESLTSKTVEFASGVTGALPMHSDSATGYLYPLIQSVPTELGGLSSYSFLVQATTNALVIKTSPGQVYGVHFSVAVDVVPAFLRFYDLAVAPTVGTSTIKRRIMIPGAAVTTIGARWDITFPLGITFGTGIAIAVTSTIADTSTAAVANADRIVVEIDYK